MNVSVKKVNVTEKTLTSYKAQTTVVRKSGNSRLNYGKIAGLQDMDPD